MSRMAAETQGCLASFGIAISDLLICKQVSLCRKVLPADVSYLQPVSFRWRPTAPSDRLGDLLLAVHPSAQFLSFVLMHNSHLVLATVLVRHASFSPALRALRASLALMDLLTLERWFDILGPPSAPLDSNNLPV